MRGATLAPLSNLKYGPAKMTPGLDKEVKMQSSQKPLSNVKLPIKDFKIYFFLNVPYGSQVTGF